MDSIFVPSSLTTPFASRFSLPRPTSASPQFTLKRHSKIRVTSSKTPKNPPFFPLVPSFFKFSLLEASRTSECCKEEEKSILEASTISKGRIESVISVTKCAVYTIFCIAVSFSPVVAFKVPAVAAPVATGVSLNRKESGKEKEKHIEVILKSKNHEYSDCTRRLLEKVSSLLMTIEEVRGGNGDVEGVKLALKAVKKRKEELEDEIMGGFEEEMKELKKEKDELMMRTEQIVNDVLRLQRDVEKAKEEKKAQKLERIERMEKQYGIAWERLGEIEDKIFWRETMTFSVGVRELCSIERECEELVQSFNREIKKKSIER